MIKRILTGLGIVLILMASIVIIRTIRLSYDLPAVDTVEQHDFNEEAVVDRLSQAIQFQTVSRDDPEDFNYDEFEDFIAFMEASFPNMHDELERERVGGYTLLFRWEGTDPDLDPGMMMGHYDVVPVEEGTADEWTYPPYAGEVAEGFVWGRGALDDKSGLMSTFEGVEYMLEQGFEPERTMYFAANHDEEVGGHRGASQVADLLEERGVELAFLVDEGLPIAEEVMEGIESPLAMIGVAEKGRVNVELSVTREGGHASMPPRQTAIGDVAEAVRQVQENRMPGRFADLVQDTFEPISAELPFVYRAALANLWLTRRAIGWQLSQIPHTNAALRTTFAPTLMRAGTATNVLPARATANLNVRIHPNDSVDDVLNHLEDVIENPDIEITARPGAEEPSIVSDTEAEPYQRLKKSIWETFGELPIAPSIFVAASDTRHFQGLTDNIYRHRSIRATPADQGRIHGTDERVGVDNYIEMVQFQIRALHNLTSGFEESVDLSAD